MNMRFILALMLLSACDDFDPRSLLQAPRVVGVVAEPPAAQFGDTVQLTSIEYGANIAKREWSICLLSLGPFKDYECFNEALIIPIDETDKSVSFTIDETLLAPLFMFLETDGAELAESCGDACLGRDGSEQTYLDLQVGLKTAWDDGSDMVTIKQVRVSLDGEMLNTNPVITRVQVDGAEVPATLRANTSYTLSIEVDAARLESYVDSGGRSRQEEATTTWYSTIGRFDLPITFGETQETKLKLPKTVDTTEATVIAVVRDGRGGTDFRIFQFELEPSP